MGISCLLWLQSFRNSKNDAWSPFMERISMFSVIYTGYYLALSLLGLDQPGKLNGKTA